MTLDEARAAMGQGVVYIPSEEQRAETGVITSVSTRWVFVRYSDQHPEAGGKATSPAQLTLL
jgi:hypothetical protein